MVSASVFVKPTSPRRLDLGKVSAAGQRRHIRRKCIHLRVAEGRAGVPDNKGRPALRYALLGLQLLVRFARCLREAIRYAVRRELERLARFGKGLAQIVDYAAHHLPALALTADLRIAVRPRLRSISSRSSPLIGR